MRPKSLILLSLALGCGLVASLGINQVMSKGSPVAQANTEKVTIFVAKKPIALNDMITEDMLATKEYTKEEVHKEALTSLEDILERRARQRISADEPILDTKLMPKGDTARASEHISPGMRSVAIKVDATSTGGYLVKPGDKVDLMVYLRKSGSTGVARTMIKTFMQNVKVFAIDNTLTESPDGKGKKSMKTVTLEVTPQQAQIVTMATSLGRVTMALRSPEDEQPTETSTMVNLQDVLGVGGTDAGPVSDPFPPVAPKPEPRKEPGLLGSVLGQITAPRLAVKQHEMEVISGAGVQRWRIAEGSFVPTLIGGKVEPELGPSDSDLPPLPFLGEETEEEQPQESEESENS